jgi:hypothetical protein
VGAADVIDVKKRYIVIGLLAAALCARGQQKDAAYTKKIVSQTDVQLMLSYYTQDNNHSAVTGGLGTEDLQVYATELAFDHRKDSLYRFHFDCGVDIISSASTDNISTQSGASRVDARNHFGVGYGRIAKPGQFSKNFNATLSFESDYWSNGFGYSTSRVSRDGSREISASIQTYFDDLRWGRLSPLPESLVYPEELTDTTWFTVFRRTSYNVDVGFMQVLNKKMVLGIYPGFVYQSGLLSTPFHRVYFTDGSMRVENLPGSRWKFPIGFQLNSFLGKRTVMRLSYRFYIDDFGIVAHTSSIELPVKISARFTVTPFVRFYKQSSADYFKPFAQHKTSQAYYTSDYDLSAFTNIKPGFALGFGHLQLRYAFYKRSDGLMAQMLTVYLSGTSIVRK